MKDWKAAAENRSNTYKWNEDIPSVEDIGIILNALHTHSPSKQRVVRYEVVVIRNDDPVTKRKIYEAHKTDVDLPYRYNPQVLAPWLLAFRKRDISSTMHDADYNMDVGIATSTIIYTASDLGIDTGLAKCINDEDLIIEAIGFVPDMVIGLGYHAPGNRYFCPVTNTMADIMNTDDEVKPLLTEYAYTTDPDLLKIISN